MPLLRLSEPQLSTQQILANTADYPLHRWRRDDLDQQPVSSHSRWGDPKWVFDNTTHGATKSVSTIYWATSLPDERSLLDPQHASLLDWLKRLVWSLFSAPGDGSTPLKPGNLSIISQALRYWVIWLVDHHISLPSEITPGVTTSYVNHLESEEDDDPDRPALTEYIAYNRLLPFTLLWRQRFALESV